MSISFEKGKYFPDDISKPHKLTAAEVRAGVIESSQYVTGGCILTPQLRPLSQAIGRRRADLYNIPGLPNDYSAIVEHATGLLAVKHAGLILIEDGTISPLKDNPPKEPPVYDPVIITEITEQIADLASKLPPEIASEIGRQLHNPDKISI